MEKDDPQIKTEYLYTKWFNSFEEGVIEGELYRPQGYKEFPDTRYRRTITFEIDGKCKWLLLSPLDAHYEMDCNWELNQTENVISIKSDSRKEILRLKIIELKKDLLKIQSQELIN